MIPSKLNLANVPNELLFILNLLKEEKESYGNINYGMFPDPINWDLFLDLAKHHRLFPILHHKIKKLDHVPEKIRTALSKSYKFNTFKMLQLSAEMSFVNQHFTENDIPVLFLKGPNLAHDLYGDISLRTSSDLDILIPIRQLNAAEQLLLNLGYEKDDYIETILGDWSWRHHHVTYFHKEKGLKLEIHWRLHPGPGFEPSFRHLWDRRRKSTLFQEPLYILGKEDLFFFLITHGARHGWSRLRWLLDIKQLLEQEVNWKIIHNLLKKYHYAHVGGQALALANYLLDASLTKNAERFIEKRSLKLAQEAVFYLERMVNLHTDPVPEEVSNYHSRHLFSLMSFMQKNLFLLSWLFPFPEDAETLPLPRKLHFLYFPLRPMLWAWRKTRKHAIQ